MLKEGDLAPAFEANDQDGKTHMLKDYHGLWLLLYFYPKDDTPGCTAEACGIRDVYAELTKQFHVLGVSADSGESHQKFIQKFNLPFPLLADTDRKIIQAYEASLLGFGKRVSFLIDPAGMIRKVYTKIDTKGHAKQVMEDQKVLVL